MNFDLSPEHELVRSTVRKFAEERVAPVAEELDREHRFPYELVRELAELGLMGMPIPEDYGGGGTDTLAYAIAIEELTRVDSSVAITVAAHTSLGTMPIFLFGNEEQKREWLPQLTSGKKLGWRASDTRELSFKDAAVPEGNLLGPRGEGFRQFLEILDGGRISVAAMGVGLAQGAYDLAFRYAQEREQFGKPIARFQAVQFQLADMAVEIEAGRNLVYKAAWLKDEGRPFAKEAAMAKLYTGELSHRVANAALQMHGGYGFMDESAISRLYRDQKILEIGEGTNEVQRMVIARHLGL